GLPLGRYLGHLPLTRLPPAQPETPGMARSHPCGQEADCRGVLDRAEASPYTSVREGVRRLADGASLHPPSAGPAANELLHLPRDERRLPLLDFRAGEDNQPLLTGPSVLR